MTPQQVSRTTEKVQGKREVPWLSQSLLVTSREGSIVRRTKCGWGGRSLLSFAISPSCVGSASLVIIYQIYGILAFLKIGSMMSCQYFNNRLLIFNFCSASWDKGRLAYCKIALRINHRNRVIRSTPGVPGRRFTSQSRRHKCKACMTSLRCYCQQKEAEAISDSQGSNCPHHIPWSFLL